MSQISVVLKKRLKDSITRAPLGVSEFRGIEGVNGHYFSSMPTHDGKEHLFATNIDGTTVYIYKVAEV